jgi:hypothetical protein
MDVEIGSNVYTNTDGTIEVEGVPQLSLALARPEGPLLINFIMYDDTGKIAVKLVNSAMAFNQRRAYELAKASDGLVLTNTDDGTVILHAQLVQGRAVVRQGRFRTIRGHTLDITADEWKVDRLRMSKETKDLGGKSVQIG